MPSNEWISERQRELDEIEAAHKAIGGMGPGRRFATQQLNHAYAMLLASQFQGFCRDLHGESVDFIVVQVPSPGSTLLRSELLKSRKLDHGNPNPGNIGSDFGRLGMDLWDDVSALDKRNEARQDRLEQLNKWRNAIAHQSFDPKLLGSKPLQLVQVRRWRLACNQLCVQIDDAVRGHLQNLFGLSPW